jgi:hypothetical protein
MGYDMYLIKADKTKIRDISNPYFTDFELATIDEVNSCYPVLRKFYLDRDDLEWIYEEYNIVSENVLSDIVAFLKLSTERNDYKDCFGEDFNGVMTKYVYEKIKGWLPLKENEIVYFEEDS